MPTSPPPIIKRSDSAVALTGIGRVREHNEDCVGLRDDLIVLADGMGGHEHGEIASMRAVAAFLDYAKRATGKHPTEEVLREAFRVANVSVSLVPDGAGTTLVGARLEIASAYIAHTGDSRAYILRGGEAIQLTRDHGIGHLVTKCLGARMDRWEPDVRRVDTLRSDTIMLCSDGLHGLIDDETIASLWRASGGDLERFAVDAYNEAMSEGGDDNCSIVVARSR
jgi:PPM family protein phosphatase